MIRAFVSGTIFLFAGAAYAQSTPITGATCVSTGVVEVTKTILVASGTFDGGCKTYVPRLMNADSHSETIARDALMFKVENGARLRNVIIDGFRIAASARPIEIRNGATLDNVKIVRAPGEVFIASRTAGTVNIAGLTAIGNGFLQRHFSANGIGTTFKISNCILTDANQVFRQLGGTTYQTTVAIDRCDFSNITGELMRTDSPLSTAALTNSRLHNVKTICRGYAPGNCLHANNVIY